MNRKAKALQSFFPIRVMPSRIYWDLTKEDMKRPIMNGKPVNMHKWVMGIRKRRQSGYVNALVLLPKPKMKRTRKRAIVKAAIASMCKECHGYGIVGRFGLRDGQLIHVSMECCQKCKGTESE